MNERIEQLAEQAGLWNDMEPTRRSGRYVGYMNVADVERFAELIIQECAHVGFNAAYPSKGVAVAVEIKEHFGVKE